MQATPCDPFLHYALILFYFLSGPALLVINERKEPRECLQVTHFYRSSPSTNHRSQTLTSPTNEPLITLSKAIIPIPN